LLLLLLLDTTTYFRS